MPPQSNSSFNYILNILGASKNIHLENREHTTGNFTHYSRIKLP